MTAAVSPSARRHSLAISSPSSSSASAWGSFSPSTTTATSSATGTQKVARRKSFISRDRDLFANGERDAVRCRPTSIYVPEDILRGPPDAAEQGEERAAALRWSRRRSSVQHAPPVPEIPQAYALQQRRGSEAAPVSKPIVGFASPPKVPLVGGVGGSRQLSPSSDVEYLASPPGIKMRHFTPPVSLSLLSPSTPAPAPTSHPLRSRALSSTSTLSASSSHSSSRKPPQPQKVKRKPVPALSLEDDLDLVSDPSWDGSTSTPPSVFSSSGSSYGFPHLIAAVSPSTASVGASPATGQEDALGLLGSIAEKVRRMSLETSQTGGTGLGLGLSVVGGSREESLGNSEEEEGVKAVDFVGKEREEGRSRRKTLAEVKAERLAARRRSEEQVQTMERVGGKQKEEGRRRATEGSVAGLTISAPSALVIPEHVLQHSVLISPARSSHGSTTSTSACGLSSSDNTSRSMSRASSVSTSPTASSSKRAFRPFALLRQHTSRTLGAHEVIIPPLAPSGAAGAKSPRDDDGLVDAWMDIIVGKEEEQDEPEPTPAPFVFGAPPRAQPEVTETSSTAAAEQERTSRASYVPFAPDELSDLANSLPPLLYSPREDEEVQQREEPMQVQEDEDTMMIEEDAAVSTSGSEEFVDASEGRSSLDHGSQPSFEQAPPETFPSFPFAPSSGGNFSFSMTDDTRLLNLAVPRPRRLNKRSASACGLAELSPKPVSVAPAFASVPPSPKPLFSFDFSHRHSKFVLAPPSLSSHLTSSSLATITPTSPIPQPAAKRQHLSSPTSPRLPFSLESVQAAILQSQSQQQPLPALSPPKQPRTDKPLPPRPPRPPKSARRSVNLSGRRSSGASAPPSALEREGLGNCPVLLGRVASIASSSGESSCVEGVKPTTPGEKSTHRFYQDVLVPCTRTMGRLLDRIKADKGSGFHLAVAVAMVGLFPSLIDGGLKIPQELPAWLEAMGGHQ
ncbi:hypothetical protein JCM8547_007685 [Rhodosporidiobolus lusitaniae]